MYATPKMPKLHLAFTASDMEVGKRAFFSDGYLRVDLQGSGWVHPFAEPIYQQVDVAKLKRENTYGLILERVEGGFRVDFRLMTPSSWRREPQPVHGVGWFPVVEFVVMGEPPV
jgi:hypothetical protein